jgi:maleate isomerase
MVEGVQETAKQFNKGRPARIGLLVPSSNTVLESDVHKALPLGKYSTLTARMYLVATTREAEIEMMNRHAPKAAADLATTDPDLLVFGCTSAGSIFGLDYDAEICATLGKIAGCASMGTISAVTEALERRGFRRIAVITPYIEDLTQAVAKAVCSPTRMVVSAHGMGIDLNVALADPTPNDIVEFAQASLRQSLRHRSFDGIFVSCTNFRALEAVPSLEAMFDVPVVTSNLAIIEGIRSRFEGHSDRI